MWIGMGHVEPSVVGCCTKKVEKLTKSTLMMRGPILLMKETIGGTGRMSGGKERERNRPTYASGSERDRPTYPTGCPIFGRFRPVVVGIGLLFSSGRFRRMPCQMPGYLEL